jgi:hypothetical protein
LRRPRERIERWISLVPSQMRSTRSSRKNRAAAQVAEEDVALVEAVQRGLDSGMVPQGRLMTASEQLIADFQRRVRDALVG